MKKLKNLLFVLAVLFSMVFLAGCEKSAQIGTTLTFDKDIKGERSMHVELSKESFTENVTATMEDIQAIFTESCPKELTYEFLETESSYTVDVHLAFDSEEDYYEKVEAITGQEDPGEITVADSVFNSGFEVNENFESKDLLKWLSDALIEKQFISSENQSYIFDNSGIVVKYEGEEFTSNSYIAVNETVSTQLSRIQVKTSLNLDGTWNREVAFYVPKDSMDTNGDAIKEFLEDGVAKGAEGSWEDYKEDGEKGQVYTIKAENIPVETMEKLMQKAFHTKESSVTDQSEEYYGEESSTNLIRSSAYMKEEYDLSEFVSGDYSNLQVEYIVEANGKESSANYSVYNSVCSITQEFSTYLIPTGIDLTTKVTGANKYNRTFKFTFEGLKKEEKEFLKSQAEGLAKDLGKVSVKDKKNAYILTISVKGDSEKVGKLYKKLFGYSMDAHYAVEHKWMGFTNTFAYEENVYLGEFLPYGTGQVVDVNYELSFGAGAKVSSKLENAYEKKGNTLYLSGSTDSSIAVTLYGSRINLRGIISIFVLVLAVVSIVFFVLLLLRGRMKKAQPYAAPGGMNQAMPMAGVPGAENQGVSAEATLETVGPVVSAVGTPVQPEEGQLETSVLPEFCTGCGAKIEDSEAMFCVKCGKKRGE